MIRSSKIQSDASGDFKFLWKMGNHQNMPVWILIICVADLTSKYVDQEIQLHVCVSAIPCALT